MAGELHILLEPYRAVYVEIPKVACSSIKTVFAQLLGISLEASGGDPHRVQYPAPPQPPRDSPVMFPGLFSFAFVRNPWDRLVSCYRDKIGGEVDGFTHFTIRPGVANCLARFDVFVAGMSFEQFARAVAAIPDEEADPHFRSQCAFVTNQAGALGVDYIGRYESLAADFQTVQERIGLPPIELPRMQAAGKSARYRSFYTPQIRQIVTERYQKDIEMFGYEFEPAIAG